MGIDDLAMMEYQEVKYKSKGHAKMILAYHTKGAGLGRGVAFGGIRVIDGTVENAFTDAYRLSKAMTYKLALLGSDYGGAKAVFLKPEKDEFGKFILDVGDLIEEERGQLIAALDFGFDHAVADKIATRTKYLLGYGANDVPNSSFTTALGVVKCIQVCLKKVFGSSSIRGRSFAVQGIGSVGYEVSRFLADAGAYSIFVADSDVMKAAKACGLSGHVCITHPNDVLSKRVDVVVPCGPAYVINKRTIPALNCKIIAGAANCQLEDEVTDDTSLKKREILIAPDYVINSGGVALGIVEYRSVIKGQKTDIRFLNQCLRRIQHNLKDIFAISQRREIGTYEAAQYRMRH